MTNKITISNITIHQDSESRYSLNDLHQASGGERKHEPAAWLRLEQTNELIQEILNTQMCVFKPVDSRKGRYGGTYVCKELVYSYAMWISAVFALKVIKAYDELLSNNMTINSKALQCATESPQVKSLPAGVYYTNAFSEDKYLAVAQFGKELEVVGEFNDADDAAVAKMDYLNQRHTAMILHGESERISKRLAETSSEQIRDVIEIWSCELYPALFKMNVPAAEELNSKLSSIRIAIRNT